MPPQAPVPPLITKSRALGVATTEIATPVVTFLMMQGVVG